MLEVRVKKSFQGFDLKVDFSVNRETLAILGPSGSGKTMTLQCIAGLLKPDEGYIKLNDKVLFDSSKKYNLPAQKRKVGFVFQNYALFPHLTVNQNICYGIRHLDEKEKNRKVADLLDKMNIPALGNRYPRQLSAGQQQRVAVARALAPEPDVLLLDEPFSALDSLVKERLQLELQNLQRFYDGNILFVTHDLTEGYKLSSRMAVFESGRIVQHDQKEKVVSFPTSHVVARLVGFKNLMKGTVNRIEGNTAIIDVPELGSGIKAEIRGGASYSSGEMVTIGIRPEYIRLNDNPGENTFLCTADRIVEEVSSVHYFFHANQADTDSHYIMVISSRTGAKVLGENNSCYLHLPFEHVVMIKE